MTDQHGGVRSRSSHVLEWLELCLDGFLCTFCAHSVVLTSSPLPTLLYRWRWRRTSTKYKLSAWKDSAFLQEVCSCSQSSRIPSNGICSRLQTCLLCFLLRCLWNHQTTNKLCRFFAFPSFYRHTLFSMLELITVNFKEVQLKSWRTRFLCWVHF